MKKVLSVSLFLAVAAIALFSGCTATSRTMREPNARMEWEKSDFTFSEQVTGEASTTRILMIDWARLFKKETGSVEGGAAPLSLSSIPVIGGLVTDRTTSYALYDLMQKNPGYDVVFYPQYETTRTWPGPLAFFYQKSHVKVTARLAKIN